MKKIITAIDNPKLNEELKKENNFKIICKDIQYREAILEVLEKYKNIDIIIISEKIIGEISFDKLIENIKLINEKIKIIFILETENDYLEKILIKNNIKDIYYNSKINLFDLIKIINKTEINMEEEIIKLKKIIKENNMNYNKIKNNYSKENTEIKNKKIDKEKYLNNKNTYKKTKIITFLGGSKSGKSTISFVISQYLSRMRYKVLLIDGDMEKQDLSIIIKGFENKKLKTYKNNNIKKFNNNHEFNFFEIKNILKIFTKKINDNFYFYNGLNILLNNKKYKDEKIIKKEINIFFEIIKNKYNYIIIDLSKNNFNNINKEILEKSNLNFLISEANVLAINEINNLLNFYLNKLEIRKDNLQIILNKNNIISINKNLVSNFLNFKNKIHIIKENKFFSILINDYYKINILLKNKNVKKDMYKIIKEIERIK